MAASQTTKRVEKMVQRWRADDKYIRSGSSTLRDENVDKVLKVMDVDDEADTLFNFGSLGLMSYRMLVSRFFETLDSAGLKVTENE